MRRSLIGGVKDSDKRDNGGEDELGSEDTIDLADEAPPWLKPRYSISLDSRSTYPPSFVFSLL
jgi:hypothetical protein